MFFFSFYILSMGGGDKTLRQRLGEMGHGSDHLVLVGINLKLFSIF